MNKVNHEEIIKALLWRYAVKNFDTVKKISDEDLHAILESGRLAPSSVGIEPWKFIVVNNTQLRVKIRAVAYDQPKVTDASHLIVIARRTDAGNLSSELIDRTAGAQNRKKEELDELKQMADNFIAMKPAGAALDGWLAAQTYIPLGMMIQTAALLAVDTCPMEGFDPAQVDDILGLTAKNLTVVTMLAVGYRDQKDQYSSLPKTRRSFDEVIESIE